MLYYSVKKLYLQFEFEFIIITIAIQTQRYPYAMTEFNQQTLKKEILQTITQKIKRNGSRNLINKGFMNNYQIELKKQSKINAINQQRIDLSMNQQIPAYKSTKGLPNGIKLVCKQSILDNKYTLFDVKSIDGSDRHQVLKGNCQNNLLSLVKNDKGMQLAICVCIYSQQKSMLKATMKGIEDNIKNLVNHYGINQDQIAVFVMMDGILELNDSIQNSIEEYFGELEHSNEQFLDQKFQEPLKMSDLAKLTKQEQFDQIMMKQTNNLTNFLYRYKELENKKERRFKSVKNQYKKAKKILEQIQTLKKSKKEEDRYYDNLPEQIKVFYDQALKMLREQQIQDLRQNNIALSKPIILKSIQQCQNYYTAYIQSRDKLAFLIGFRHQIQKKSEEEQEENTLFQRNKKQINLNLFFCVKYKNQGKLSSHNWFFNGFCRQLKPKYTILLDVGLVPSEQALCKMYNYLKKDETVGGVCGYMSLKLQQLSDKQSKEMQQLDGFTRPFLSFFDIQRAQQVQYHFAHLIDKSFESMFDFIHVLPGAFSAYNMKAIMKYQSSEEDHLLKEYFSSIDQKIKNKTPVESQITTLYILLNLLPSFISTCFLKIDDQSEEQMLYNQNINLAEDRILCLGIHKKGFHIRFLPDAYAYVDSIRTIHQFLGQRKRWINGSCLAFNKVKEQIGLSWLYIQITYLTVTNLFTYIAPSFFLFTVYVTTDIMRLHFLKIIYGDLTNSNQQYRHNQFKEFNNIIYFICILLMLSFVFYSIHFKNSSEKFKGLIYLAAIFFGIYSIGIFFVFLSQIITFVVSMVKPSGSNQNLNIQLFNLFYFYSNVSLGLGIILCLLMVSLIRKKADTFFDYLTDIIFGILSFIFYIPTYLNILSIYSLCRLDDISWGTKGLDSDNNTSNKLRYKWKIIKLIHVGKFMFYNILLSVIFINVSSDQQTNKIISQIILCLVTSLILLKMLIALVYLVMYCISQKTKSSKVLNVDPGAFRDSSRIEALLDRYKDELFQDINWCEFAISQYSQHFYKSKIYSSLHKFIYCSKNKNESMVKSKQQFKIQLRNSTVIQVRSRAAEPSILNMERTAQSRYDSSLRRTQNQRLLLRVSSFEVIVENEQTSYNEILDRI